MTRRLLLAAAVLGVPLAAHSQRVTVNFERTPIQEALDEIQRQTGAYIRHPFTRAGAAETSVSLEMEDAPVPAVLRAVADQLGCHLRWDHGMWRMERGPDPFPQSLMTRVGPYELRIRYIKAEDYLSLSYEATDSPLTIKRTILIHLRVAADAHLDGARLCGVRNVSATADTGERVEEPVPYRPMHPKMAERGKERRLAWSRRLRAAQGSFRLDNPGGGARRLVSLEGELILDAHVREVCVEVPLAELPQSANAEGYAIEVTRSGRAGSGRWVEVLVTPPTREPGQYRQRGPYTNLWRMWLRTSAGQLCSYTGGWGIPGDFPPPRRPVRFRAKWNFGRPDGDPETLIFSFVLPSQEREYLPFRFENVPIPRVEE